MKLKNKKIIARELLILAGSLAFSIMILGGALLHNVIVNISVERRIKSLENIEKTYTKKLDNQKKFTENLANTSSYERYRDGKVWNIFERLYKNDSIDNKWNDWTSKQRQLVGFSNVNDFKKYISDNSLTKKEKKSTTS